MAGRDPLQLERVTSRGRREAPRILLVGPYDPSCGEYTFLAPPLGVWRLQGTLAAAGFEAEVFDPNLQEGPVEAALRARLRERPWDVIGVSTTGMTLRHDLALAHLSRFVRPGAVLVAGGMEATFRPERAFELGPFDLVALGEGERPLLEIAQRLRLGAPLDDVPGTAWRAADGAVMRRPQRALEREALRDAIFRTPYERMPYAAYWQRLEERCRVRALPFKADREARLAEIRSVRLMTLNYCPMNCSFCSSTAFLTAAQGSTARIARLEADECLAMIRRIAAAHPGVRTVIFQDDIFAFPSDRRVIPLCDAIVAAKQAGEIPPDLSFISTNRIDAMDADKLLRMRLAGFRVLGFGIESFSRSVLKEFNKERIHPHIEPVLRRALDLGITPFLDLILTSPRGTLADLAENVREAYRWVVAGCEVGMYPYVIPFSGAAMASDPELVADTRCERHRIAGTAITFEQPAKILPRDRATRSAILEMEARFADLLTQLESRVAHLPSRTRSLLWVAVAAPVLHERGAEAPAAAAVLEELVARLPAADAGEREDLWRMLGGRSAEPVHASI